MMELIFEYPVLHWVIVFQAASLGMVAAIERKRMVDEWYKKTFPHIYGEK